MPPCLFLLCELFFSLCFACFILYLSLSVLLYSRIISIFCFCFRVVGECVVIHSLSNDFILFHFVCDLLQKKLQILFYNNFKTDIFSFVGGDFSESCGLYVIGCVRSTISGCDNLTMLFFLYFLIPLILLLLFIYYFMLCFKNVEELISPFFYFSFSGFFFLPLILVH